VRVQFEGSCEIDEIEVEFSGEADVSYREGRYSGPPEQCYESECEVNIIAASTIPPGFEERCEEQMEEAAWAAYERDCDVAMTAMLESMAKDY